MSVHRCAICGEKAEADRMIYSRFTRRRFCRDDRACAARLKANATVKKAAA